MRNGPLGVALIFGKFQSLRMFSFRMLYGTYRALGFFYGSGVVVAGCKTVIGGRCKGSGMLWSEPGSPQGGWF